MEIKYMLIGASFVGGYLLSQQIKKELYESGTLSDEKVEHLKSSFEEVKFAASNVVESYFELMDKLEQHKLRGDRVYAES